MVKKKNTGLAALELDTTISESQPESPKETNGSRKAIIFRVAPAVHKKISLLAVEEETTVQALMEHAIDLVFAEKGVG